MATTPTGYTPSPRPSYAQPTLIRRRDVCRHIWGDQESGLVADWIYASTGKIHALVFGLAPGRWFKHSPSFRTVFGADELFYVLRGEMLLANPETGEVVRCRAGRALFFSRDTWHHVRAEGAEPLRVLEFFAPPPSQGTSGAYAARRPYLAAPRYCRNEQLGNLDQPSAQQTLRHIRARDHVLRMEGEVTVGLIASTKHLTVAELQVPAGSCAQRTAHGGDALLFGLDGELMVRTFWNGESATFELAPQDAVFVPQEAQYELLSFSGSARALLGVAPSYLV